MLQISFGHLSLLHVFFQVVVKWQRLQLGSGQYRSEGDLDDDGDNGDDSCQCLLKKAIISLTTTVLKMNVCKTMKSFLYLIRVSYSKEC